MTQLSYSRLISELFPRITGGVQWGLGRTAALLRAAGDPHRRFQVVHVAGTNGKGSVAAFVASVLQAGGARTGLYSSPHLCDFRERFLLDGQPLGPTAILDAARRLWPEIEASDASFFEATTAIGFLALAEAGAEVVVVEVGLGGRLDATNVVQPALTVVTNIGLDHTQYLGSTIGEVAAEKAGIFKAGVPAVVGETGALALAVLEERARAVGSPFHAVPADWPADVRVSLAGTAFRMGTVRWCDLELRTRLIGAHQARNAALAAAALERAPDLPGAPTAATLRRGIREARWPGRFQLERMGSQLWIFDAAHNAPGVAALAGTLDELALDGPLTVVCGILSDKDWAPMVATLAARAQTLILTVPATAPPHRRWDPGAAAALGGGRDVVVEPRLGEALALACSTGTGTVLVTGSLHTVGDALLVLGRSPWPPEESVAAPSPLAAAPGMGGRPDVAPTGAGAPVSGTRPAGADTGADAASDPPLPLARPAV